MEGAFGADFSDVRMHTGGDSRELNDRIQAKAFTAGNHVYMRDGAPDISRTSDQHLVAHELTHVIQQRGGQSSGSDSAGVHRLAVGNIADRVGNGVHRQTVVRRKGGKKDATSPEAPADLDTLTAQRGVLETEKRSLEQQILDQTDKVARSSFLSKIAANSTLKKLQKKLQKVETQLVDLGVTIAPLQLAKDQADALALQNAEAEKQRKADAKQKRAEVRAEKKKQAEEKAEAERKQREAAAAQKLIDDATKPYSAVAAMKLPKLVEFAATTPNWGQHSSMDATSRALVGEVLAFASVVENQGPTASWTTATIETGSVDAGVSVTELLAWMPAYVAAAGERRDPFALSVYEPAQAGLIGEALGKLLGAFPRWVLAHAMEEEQLIDLLAGDYIDDVIAYYTYSSPPIFQAEEGEDFNAYLAMRDDDNVDPASFQGGPLSAYIRNFHRFEADALKALATNLADKSKSKPLTLILHTALDHNGAFHRDPYMTDVLTNTKNLTLMIEGGASLAAYQSLIGPLATEYGNNGKLDQVMFAGHGGSRVIEMGGTIAENTTNVEKYGAIKQVDEAIDLDGDKDKALAFFDEILNHMDKDVVDPLGVAGPGKQANRRILFNACLTNSNTVATAVSTGSQAAARAEVKNYIENNASLATFMANYAKSKNSDVSSLGANASITQVELIDKNSGALGMFAPTDEFVTSPKLVYAEKGREPHGVLLAALEAWAYQPTETFAVMEERAKKSSPEWSEAVIEGCYEAALVNRGRKNFGMILQKMADAAEKLSSVTEDSKCRVATLDSVCKFWSPIPASRDALVRRLGATTVAGQNRSVAMVLHQVQAGTLGNSSSATTLVDSVLANFDAKTARDYVDVKYLVDTGVMASIMGRTPSKGTMLLALLGQLDAAKPAVCKSHLASLLHPGAPIVAKLPAVDPVPLVPVGIGPRDEIPEVPEVKGCAKVEAIAGHREERAAVPDLPKLPKLEAVAGPPEVKKAKKSKTSKPGDTPEPESKPGEAPAAPGRAARDGRAEAPEVPLVKPFFEDKHGLDALLAGRATLIALATSVTS